MSILDDAIREHLELKRAHGADESELKRLEDEAFGPAERPDQAGAQIDPFAEAPTEFLGAPGDAAAEPDAGGRRINVADLQEPPPPKEEEEPEGSAEAAEPEGPVEEEHPAMEHKTIAQPAPDDRPAPPTDSLQPDPEAPHGDGPSEEREAIAEQPTQFFDVEQQFDDTSESASPSDEQLIDAEGSEPRLTPVEPIDDDEPEDEFDEFFSEQRLSDELNQALEAPLPDEPGAPTTDESPFLDDEESGEHDLPEDSREHDLPDEARDEADAADEYQPHEPGHADALEDTPEFLEESPEDDDAWFEQRPPKDFDFGD
jgi:hypothetical protein